MSNVDNMLGQWAHKESKMRLQDLLKDLYTCGELEVVRDGNGEYVRTEYTPEGHGLLAEFLICDDCEFLPQCFSDYNGFLEDYHRANYSTPQRQMDDAELGKNLRLRMWTTAELITERTSDFEDFLEWQWQLEKEAIETAERGEFG